MAIIKCPECGHQVSDQAPTCPSCGIVIAGRVTKCRECGEVVFNDQALCPNCHVPLQKHTGPQATQASSHASSQAHAHGNVNDADGGKKDAADNNGKGKP